MHVSPASSPVSKVCKARSRNSHREHSQQRDGGSSGGGRRRRPSGKDRACNLSSSGLTGPHSVHGGCWCAHCLMGRPVEPTAQPICLSHFEPGLEPAQRVRPRRSIQRRYTLSCCCVVRREQDVVEALARGTSCCSVVVSLAALSCPLQYQAHAHTSTRCLGHSSTIPGLLGVQGTLYAWRVVSAAHAAHATPRRWLTCNHATAQ